jgi:hypothetical protein
MCAAGDGVSTSGPGNTLLGAFIEPVKHLQMVRAQSEPVWTLKTTSGHVHALVSGRSKLGAGYLVKVPHKWLHNALQGHFAVGGLSPA